ncbi:hypothetical protein [Endozoicomonas sp. 4G]|uniref:hypothetical protein n=1 Tax=Endozoicomonas sp. 4G TaxID=2872754 RepID=UPI002078C3FC|nr:hypothetical protein [Endozoicomonas sp. 4G]
MISIIKILLLLSLMLWAGIKWFKNKKRLQDQLRWIGGFAFLCVVIIVITFTWGPQRKQIFTDLGDVRNNLYYGWEINPLLPFPSLATPKSFRYVNGQIEAEDLDAGVRLYVEKNAPYQPLPPGRQYIFLELLAFVLLILIRRKIRHMRAINMSWADVKSKNSIIAYQDWIDRENTRWWTFRALNSENINYAQSKINKGMIASGAALYTLQSSMGQLLKEQILADDTKTEEQKDNILKDRDRRVKNQLILPWMAKVITIGHRRVWLKIEEADTFLATSYWEDCITAAGPDGDYKALIENTQQSIKLCHGTLGSRCEKVIPLRTELSTSDSIDFLSEKLPKALTTIINRYLPENLVSVKLLGKNENAPKGEPCIELNVIRYVKLEEDPSTAKALPKLKYNFDSVCIQTGAKDVLKLVAKIKADMLFTGRLVCDGLTTVHLEYFLECTSLPNYEILKNRKIRNNEIIGKVLDKMELQSMLENWLKREVLLITGNYKKKERVFTEHEADQSKVIDSIYNKIRNEIGQEAKEELTTEIAFQIAKAAIDKHPEELLGCCKMAIEELDALGLDPLLILDAIKLGVDIDLIDSSFLEELESTLDLLDTFGETA